ncbi:rCG24970 [Rattus norvegicus]|uniref:RCG24970 n=1 Tax=Rattus norvegicus TaxID=10116 RepID=A6KUP7_RAT|nr:rCG24970 [Rattus norvegicus]
MNFSCQHLVDQLVPCLLNCKFILLCRN